MTMTNVGKSGTALLWTVSGTRPQYIAIGTGSQAVVDATIALATQNGSPRAFANTTFGGNQIITFDASWGAVELSGLSITEFGVLDALTNGSVWSAENFNGVAFDGTNELQVEVVFETL